MSKKIWITSDPHFSHNKNFIYEPRGFNSIDEHDAAIIERWNSVVSPEDEVYILGDLILNDNNRGIECLKQLNGIKYFTIGNHDTSRKIDLYINMGMVCCGYAHFLKYNGYHFYMSHYPTITANLDDKSLKQMMINLYGHTHQKTNFFEDRPYMYHVGLDSHNCYPVSLDIIIEDIKAKAKEYKEIL